MDSDDESYSGSGDSSSSDSSADSSEPEQERLEPVRINGTSLELPQDLCEDPNIFKEFFSVKTWNSLSEDNQQHLKSFLPNFAENDEEEKEETLQRLFAREDFNFGSPLLNFQSNLRQGNYRPDIAKMKKVLLKARDKQQKHKLRSYYARILPEVLLGRERVLTAAKATPPGPPPKLPPLPPLPSPRDHQRPPHVRAKLRYFQELAAIRSEVGAEEQPSEDENFPEGPPSQMSRRQRRHLSALQSGLGVWWGVNGTLGGGGEGRLPPAPAADWLRNVLAAHRMRRIRAEEHPELDTAGLSLADIKQRVPLVNGHRRQTNSHAMSRHTEQPQPRAKRVKKENVVPEKPVKREPKQALSRNGKSTDYDSTNEGFESKHSVLNMSVKSERSDSEDNSDDSSYVDPVESPKSTKRFKANVEPSNVKEDVPEKKSRPGSRATPSRDKMFSEMLSIKTEPPDACTPPSSFAQAVPIKLEDLEGINMMELPVELADTPPAEETRDSGLVARTHASFFSLLRELFPAPGGHRASRVALGARLAAHARSPIAPLNTWYSLVDDWNSVLSSALEFLAGESRHQPDDFVPYLQFMPQLQVYQWIGAGRDCDALLGPLCQFWLEHRRAPLSPPPVPPPAAPAPAAAPAERAPTPPPRWPTTWVVRPATAAELAEFRAQERRRYASPARSFTYTQHGYRAAVAPLRGGGGGGAARGHAVLAATRPRHVTLLALVRDAVARLPNGEGTRADIATLLKMSQWVVSGAGGEAALGGAVSGALDRLHAQRADPAVRYAPQRKLWIYLHRDRTEEEFERLYAASAAPSKSRAARSRAGRTPRALAAPPPAPPSPPAHVEPVMDSDPAMEVEVGCSEEVVGGEDSDVDVDDSGPQAAPAAAMTPSPVMVPVVPPTNVQHMQHTKVQQTARSLLLRPANVPSVVSSVPHSTPITQVVSAPGGGLRRGGVVRVLSPAAPGAGGKSLISPRAFLPTTQVGVSLSARSPNVTTVVTARRRVPSAVTSNVATSVLTVTSNVPSSLTNVQTSTTTVRSHNLHSVQLGNQTVQLSTGQAVQLSSGHAVQLSSGQAVQLTSGHAVQLSSGQAVQLSTGQAVQISGNASGQTVQLPSGQTVQLPSGQTVQLPSGQTVQLPSGQTVQLPSGQTVQLPGGQTVQLPSGQTVQLPSGQTVQLASGQTVQLGARTGGTQLLALRQTAPRAVATPDKPVQPLVAKLLTNAQGQVISVEGVMGRGRTLQLSAPLLQLQRRAAPASSASSANTQSTIQVRAGGMAGMTSTSGAGVVRVLSPALARLAGKPVLLASKPLHNILLQQADGTTVRPAVSVAASGAQTLVLSNIGGQTVRAAGNTTPTLKLQQVNPRGTLQHVKLAPGVKLQQGTSATTGGTQVLQLASGQQLKVVGGAAGRHVLARLLRPAAPSQPPQ